MYLACVNVVWYVYGEIKKMFSYEKVVLLISHRRMTKAISFNVYYIVTFYRLRLLVA